MPNAIKYNVSAETPPCVQSLTTSEGPYTYNEILDILATPEWTDPNPMV
jgi:hypothetical protein